MVAACRGNLPGLQHRNNFSAIVEVTSMIFELSCAASAVVCRVRNLAGLLIYLNDLSLLLLDGRI